VPAPTAELQVPVAQVLPGSQQGWPVPPQATQEAAAPGGSTQVVPDFEQNCVPPQQAWPAPPHAVAPLTHEPVSVHVPVLPPPQAVPPAMQTPSLFRQRPALQTFPRHAGWFIAPHAVQVPLPPPMHVTPAS
jgi:hypothetical protein